MVDELCGTARPQESGHTPATATPSMRRSSGEAPQTDVPYIIAGLSPVLTTAHDRLPVAIRRTRSLRILAATMRMRPVS